MKNLFKIILIAVFTLFVASCEKDDKNNNVEVTNSFIGDWGNYIIIEDSVLSFEIKETLILTKNTYKNAYYINYDNAFILIQEESGSLSKKSDNMLTLVAESFGESDYDTITNKYTGNMNYINLVLYYTLASRTSQVKISVTSNELIVYYGDENLNGRIDSDEYDTYLKLE